MDARLRQLTVPRGAPASSAAAATIRAARREHSIALGWGENTIVLPLLIAMAYTMFNTITSAFEFAEHELKVKDELVEKEVFSLMGSNFTALRLLAVNPSVQEYLTAAPENRSPNMKGMVQNANALFKDASNIVLTDNSGQQVVRSDEAKLVNLSARDYFQEAMKGNEYISEIKVTYFMESCNKKEGFQCSALKTREGKRNYSI